MLAGWLDNATLFYRDEIRGTCTGLGVKEAEARIDTGTGIYSVKRLRL